MATQGRTRTRAPETASRERERAPRGEPAGYMGEDGYARAKEAIAKSEARREMNQRGPFRFSMKDGEEPVEIIILDAARAGLFYMNEHEVWVGKNCSHVVCIAEGGRDTSCPLCVAAADNPKNARDGIKYPYYAMYFTVIDTRGYTNKEGKEVAFSRRLMVVKQSQIEKMTVVLNAAQKQNGGKLRGTVLLMSRNGEMSPRTGEPTLFPDTGTMFEFVSEKQLLRDYSTPAIKKDGKIVKEANADLQPFDYRKEFRKFTAEQLATAWDLPPPAGSDAALEAEWDEQEEDVAPRRGKATGKATGKAAAKPARTRTRTVVEDEVDEDEVDDEVEAEADEPQPRGRVRTRNAPQAVEEDEDEDEIEDDADDEDEDEEDDPPPRGRARTAAKAAPARGKAPARGTRSRTVAEDDDEIPFE
jgi:hypothetical protein